MINPLTTVAPSVSVIKTRFALVHVVSTRVQNACALVKYVLRKKKWAKTLSGVPRATFDPKRERLIGP